MFVDDNVKIQNQKFLHVSKLKIENFHHSCFYNHSQQILTYQNFISNCEDLIFHIFNYFFFIFLNFTSASTNDRQTNFDRRLRVRFYESLNFKKNGFSSLGTSNIDDL